MLSIPAYPFWSLALLAIDVLVIYGLAAYGGKPYLTRWVLLEHCRAVSSETARHMRVVSVSPHVQRSVFRMRTSLERDSVTRSVELHTEGESHHGDCGINHF